MPWVSLPQYRFFYRLHGESSAPRVCFLHGFMGDSRDFDETIDRLVSTAYCLTLDLPGHGQTETSDGMTGYAMPAIAQGILALLTQLDFLPCHLVGYSMGGRLALYLVHRFPESFLSLLAESASPGLATASERQQRQQQDERWAVELETTDWSACLAKWYSQPLFAALQDAPCFQPMLQRRQQNCPQTLALALRGMSTGVQLPLWEALAHLDLPITLLVGDGDLKFRDINQRMVRSCLTAQFVVLPNCGHAPHLEVPALFAAAVQAHLQQVS
ncbi:MAG TPA: 2-succinyl-6-hydroxy-2,4-cyclohexadiene-1-carboxylate synthase [Stenomitos sp.]